jgi:hypothetical protein
MFLPFGNSDKEVMIRRAKALVELLLFCLAFAVLVFSFLPSRSRPGSPRGSQVNDDRAGEWTTTVQEGSVLQTADGKFVIPDTTSSTGAAATGKAKPAGMLKKLITYTIVGTY